MEQDDRQGCSLFLLSLEECDTTEAVHPQDPLQVRSTPSEE